jgi:1,4-dihydroxy-2-naphthoate octaprenyltransferase
MNASQSALKSFILASRPKTLVASVSPVIIGASLAAQEAPLSMFFFACSLLFSLFIQIGTNYANDYFDYVQGVDTEKRIGPPRAVASGWLAPITMRNASFVFFFGAFCISLPLVFACGLWALLFTLTSIAFGILYTSGPKSLGYLGLGDILVFIYFGPVAVIGTYFVQQHAISWPIFLISLSPGLLSTAILTANNLRDADLDKLAGKNTLVVRFGRTFGNFEYTICIFLAAFLPTNFGFFFPLLILPIAAPLIRKVFLFQFPGEIVFLLPKTAMLLVFFTLFFSLECITKL